MSRRIGRILAFQALYSWDVGGADIDDLLTFTWLERDAFEQADGSMATDEDGTEVKNCLFDNQMDLFENLSADKKQEVFSFARILVKGTEENLSQIDETIKAHLSAKWSIDRVNKVALAVIRMSVYSLMFQKDIDAKIVIDEAVEIVKDYGADDSHKFTNAILDNISKDLNK